MTTLTDSQTTASGNGRNNGDGWRALNRRQLKRYVKDRGLASGIDLWRASKPNLTALLQGTIDTLPAWDEGRPRKAVATKAPANQTDIEPIVRKAVDAELKRRDDLRPVVHIHQPDNTTVKIDGITHERFAEVLKLVQAGIPVLLVGPAGSGKTKLAAQVATALDRAFTFNSMSAGVTESSLLGRILPNDKGDWTYRPAPFVRTYRDGGVHLFDEIDAADPNLMVVVNAAIANGKLAIPFADIPPIDRHADTVLIAAANTYGNGADRQYVGRNQLDAATVDRFTMGTVEVGYDRELERQIVKAILGDEPRGDDDSPFNSLLSWAWGVRDRIDSNHLRRLMSTRTIESVARRIANGETLEQVKPTYFLGWSDDEKRKVEG